MDNIAFDLLKPKMWCQRVYKKQNQIGFYDVYQIDEIIGDVIKCNMLYRIYDDRVDIYKNIDKTKNNHRTTHILKSNDVAQFSNHVNKFIKEGKHRVYDFNKVIDIKETYISEEVLPEVEYTIPWYKRLYYFCKKK